MSDLLTHEEYKAIAADLSLPVNAYVNGKFMEPKSGKTMDTMNPATSEVLGKVAACDSADVDFAVVRDFLAKVKEHGRLSTGVTGHDVTRANASK